MDYQNRAGSKFGGGGVASGSATNVDRRERLRRLALENIDLAKDPYFFRNNVGQYECRLCLTVHQNEGSYLTHTQGRKHQQNLGRRAALEDKKKDQERARQGILAPGVVKQNLRKIGRPGWSAKKIYDRQTGQYGLHFHFSIPQFEFGKKPHVRFMSAFEQQREAPDSNFKYMVVACEPYNLIAIKIPARDIDRRNNNYQYYDPDSKEFFVQFMYKTDQAIEQSKIPGMGDR